MATDRTSLLLAMLAGTCLGGAAGFFAGRGSVDLPPAAPPAASTSAQAPPLVANSFPRVSFAQEGEDIIIDQMVSYFGIDHPSYLDIGAHDPVIYSNTYLFYGRGSRGVLVEPNPVMVEKLRRTRPGDTVLPVGVGAAEAASADYYVIARGAGLLNTFSKTEVEELEQKYGPGVVEKVLKLPLVPINQVMQEHFPGGGPDILSIDTEGLDLDILRSLDFTRFRPRIVCVETLVDDTKVVSDEIVKLVTSKKYTVRGGTFINTIFVADELIESTAKRPGVGGKGP